MMPALPEDILSTLVEPHSYDKGRVTPYDAIICSCLLPHQQHAALGMITFALEKLCPALITLDKNNTQNITIFLQKISSKHLEVYLLQIPIHLLFLRGVCFLQSISSAFLNYKLRLGIRIR